MNELGRNTERRSRKNPKHRGDEGGQTAGKKEKELDILGDATVKPIDGSSVLLRQQAALVKRKKRRRIIAMIVAECIALAAIFSYAYVLRLRNMIQGPDFDVAEIETNHDINMEAVETMKGYWTIAIFGVDARDNAITKGTNADVNIICNINRDTGEIRLVSVFRDSYLNISSKGSYNKINQAYFLGGPEQAIQALNRNLDLNITDYMTFNWKAVADAINVLGGVDIELSKAEFYYINSFITETVKATGVGSTQLTHAGMNHLDGVQAVAYGRLRLMDTDFARTERQRKVIAQAFEKCKQADFKTLNVLIGTVFPQVSTSIWVDDLVSNARNVSRFHLGETTGFPQARGDASIPKKGAVVVPQTLESNVIKLHEFLFGDEDYTPSQTVKNISAKIAEDTGMYTEGRYVESVDTSGGVIQAPKATGAAGTKSAADDDDDEEEDESGKSTAVETDEDGKPVKKTTAVETDEDGNPVETSSTTAETGVKPTAAETDEDGNPIETTRHLLPGETEESSSAHRPTAADESSGSSTGTSTTPGTATGTGGTTSTTPTTSASSGTTAPGTTSGQSGTTTAPGTTTGSGTTSTVPGSTGTTSGSTSTVPGSTTSGTTTSTTPGSTSGTTSTTPGSTGTAGTTPTAAGSGSTATGGPGSAGSTSGTGTPGTTSSGTTSGSGPVSAPGQ